MALTGGILGYRSIVRMGVQGVGGANTTVFEAKIVSVDDSGPIQKTTIALDAETARYLRQAELDRLAGYIGAAFILTGTLIWGYGDLLGTIL